MEPIIFSPFFVASWAPDSKLSKMVAGRRIPILQSPALPFSISLLQDLHSHPSDSPPPQNLNPSHPQVGLTSPLLLTILAPHRLTFSRNSQFHEFRQQPPSSLTSGAQAQVSEMEARSYEKIKAKTESLKQYSRWGLGR